MTDMDLERRIDAVYDALLNAGSREQGRYCAQRLAELVAQRSPECVARMERERGLRT